MPYLQKGRQTWWGSFYTLTGERKRVSLDTPDARSARDFERVLRQIAERPEWHDVLDALVAGQITAPQLYHAYSKSDIAGLRSHLQKTFAESSDTPLEDFLPQWEKHLLGVARVTPEVMRAYRQRVCHLLARKRPFRVSHLTPSEAQDWYADLTSRVSPQTAGGYGVALASFIGFLIEREVLTRNPVADVEVPRNLVYRERHLEWGELTRLLDNLPAATRSQRAIRDCITTCYGAGAEIGAALTLKAQDVRPETREVYLRGTKNKYRSRWVRVADWCWPTIERLLASSRGRLFAPLGTGKATRSHVSRVHKQAADRLGLEDLHLHDARHTFAVRLLQVGTPVEVVSRQLGHADSSMVVKVYGRWIVSAVERDEWEKKASAKWERAAA